ncbi:OadG family protein, partial [Halarcobacter sp.]
METNLIAEAVKFMALGMGIVFIFLIVMIYALKLQAKIIGKYFP